MSTQAGKGDTPRPVDPKKYAEGYDRIFRNKKRCKRHGPEPHLYCADCAMDKIKPIK